MTILVAVPLKVSQKYPISSKLRPMMLVQLRKKLFPKRRPVTICKRKQPSNEICQRKQMLPQHQVIKDQTHWTHQGPSLKMLSAPATLMQVSSSTPRTPFFLRGHIRPSHRRTDLDFHVVIWFSSSSTIEGTGKTKSTMILLTKVGVWKSSESLSLNCEMNEDLWVCSKRNKTVKRLK